MLLLLSCSTVQFVDHNLNFVIVDILLAIWPNWAVLDNRGPDKGGRWWLIEIYKKWNLWTLAINCMCPNVLVFKIWSHLLNYSCKTLGTHGTENYILTLLNYTKCHPCIASNRYNEFYKYMYNLSLMSFFYFLLWPESFKQHQGCDSLMHGSRFFPAKIRQIPTSQKTSWSAV